MKKIALTGAHGVGKTTLATAVQEVLRVKGYSVQLAPELPREICGIVGNPEFFRQGENTLAKQMTLLYGQVQLEYIIGLVEADGFLLTDRTLADHWAYTVHFFRGELEKQDLLRLLETMIAEYLSSYSLIGYVPIEFAPVDDGIRESDVSFQAAIDRLIKNFMDDHSIPYVTVSGPVDHAEATIRVFDFTRDFLLDRVAVDRGFVRLEETKVEEDEIVPRGQLIGLIPIGRRFEFQPTDGELIRGKVAPTMSESFLQRLHDEQALGRYFHAKIRKRTLRRFGQSTDEFTLIGLRDATEQEPPEATNSRA